MKLLCVDPERNSQMQFERHRQLLSALIATYTGTLEVLEVQAQKAKEMNRLDKHSHSQMIAFMGKDDFYRLLREKELSELDIKAVKGFVSKVMSEQEWFAFITRCIENEIDPYKEMREIIYYLYSGFLKVAATSGPSTRSRVSSGRKRKNEV